MKTFFACNLFIFVMSKSDCSVRLEKLTMDKRSSLLRKFVNHGRKKFYNFGLRVDCTLKGKLLALSANIQTRAEVTKALVYYDTQIKHFIVQGLYFLYNLRIDPIRQSVCPQQTFQAQCNVTLYFTGPIFELRRKKSVENMAPGFKTFLF